MSPRISALYEFGVYRFQASDRTLWKEGRLVPLTPKALETLAVLLAAGGRLVEKEELLKAVWPETFVEEGNLAVQISLLRKTLGEEGFIETVPRRGYRFAAPITQVSTEPALIHEPPGTDRRWFVGATALAGAGGIAAWRMLRPAGSGARIRSLAVLPFQVLQGGAEQEGMGIGLADAVITRLGGMNQCIVRPTGAVREFDVPSRDPVAAGTKLGVEAVLEASLQTAGDRVRLTAQLVRVADGKHLWTDTFDLRRTDLFTLEDELSARVARSLFGASLGGGRHQAKPEAHRQVTLARYHRNRWSAADQRKAIEYCEQAVAADPAYAEAWALLASSWVALGYLFGAPPRDAYPRAEAAVSKALSLDDHLADAHHAQAAIRFFFDWKFSAVEDSLRRALAINPNAADAHHLIGVLRAVEGRHGEGIAALERALEIDPTSPWRHIGMAFQYACAGQIEPALVSARKAHDLDPALAVPLLDLFNLNMVAGRHRDAVGWYLKLPGDPSLGETFEREGIRGFLQARIKRSLERAASGGSPILVAQLYTYLGDLDQAMVWLEKAEQQRQSLVLFVNQHPMYGPLRRHPRFQALVKRIGL